MAYYLRGYQDYVPQGYESEAGVKAIQQQLNALGADLQLDGIWGPKTHAAYHQLGLGNSSASSAYGDATSYMTTDLKSLYDQVYGTMQPTTMQYEMPNQSLLKSESERILRPAYDDAINQREQQTLKNRAEIDVDAISRGMGSSSYVTDVKDRALDAQAQDIARLESDYGAALAAAVQEQYNMHMQNQMAAEQYNAQAASAARDKAFQYATTLHKNNLEQAQALANAQALTNAQTSSGSTTGSTGSMKQASSTKTASAQETFSTAT